MATIARLELTLDLDFLALYRQRATIDIGHVHSTDLSDREHHGVDTLFGHAEDPTSGSAT